MSVRACGEISGGRLGDSSLALSSAQGSLEMTRRGGASSRMSFRGRDGLFKCGERASRLDRGITEAR